MEEKGIKEKEIEKIKKEKNEKEKLIKEFEKKQKNYSEKIKNYENQISILEQNNNKKKEGINVENSKILKNKYENELKKEKERILKIVNDKIEESKIKLKKLYEEKYQKKEEELHKKLNASINEKINASLLKNSQNNEKYKNKTLHQNIKCEKCFICPIEGDRYKCSQCKDYNLCQDCEEKNGISGEHPHDFIRMRSSKTLVTIINKPKDGIFDKKKINNQEEYSFECLNDLRQPIECKKQENAELNLRLRNNKGNTWPYKNTKLICSEDTDIKINPIFLGQQKLFEEQIYQIKFDTKYYPEGNYKLNLLFEVNGKIYGKKIEIKILVKEEKKNDNIMKIINDFREEYGLSKIDYTDEYLMKLLKKKNYDKVNAFQELFGQ